MSVRPNYSTDTCQLECTEMVENSVVVVSFLILFTTAQTVGLREVETALSLLLEVLQTIWPSHLLTTRSLLHEAHN